MEARRRSAKRFSLEQEGGQDFTDSDPLHALPERVAVDRVAIAEEVRTTRRRW